MYVDEILLPFDTPKSTNAHNGAHENFKKTTNFRFTVRNIFQNGQEPNEHGKIQTIEIDAFVQRCSTWKRRSTHDMRISSDRMPFYLRIHTKPGAAIWALYTSPS